MGSAPARHSLQAEPIPEELEAVASRSSDASILPDVKKIPLKWGCVMSSTQIQALTACPPPQIIEQPDRGHLFRPQARKCELARHLPRRLELESEPLCNSASGDATV